MSSKFHYQFLLIYLRNKNSESYNINFYFLFLKIIQTKIYKILQFESYFNSNFFLKIFSYFSSLTIISSSSQFSLTLILIKALKICIYIIFSYFFYFFPLSFTNSKYLGRWIYHKIDSQKKKRFWIILRIIILLV